MNEYSLVIPVTAMNIVGYSAITLLQKIYPLSSTPMPHLQVTCTSADYEQPSTTTSSLDPTMAALS